MENWHAFRMFDVSRWFDSFSFNFSYVSHLCLLSFGGFPNEMYLSQKKLCCHCHVSGENVT